MIDDPPTDRSHAPTDQNRSRSIEAAVLRVARRLLAQGGVRQLTMEAVSAETGIAKTTLYRRWGSKEDLALAVVLDMTRHVVASPADGDVRTSLVAYLDKAITSLRTTLMGSVMQGLASDLATHPELRDKFHTRVVALRRAHLDELVRAGIQRGELRPTVDVDLLHDLLFGPVYYRLLVSRGPLDPELAAQIVDAVIPSLRRPPPRPKAT